MHLAGSERVRSCYSYGGDRKWNKLADMATPRAASSSIPIPGGIWVTGGFDGSKLRTTEMVFLNGTRKVGTPLPAARNAHCLVNYVGKIFSTGGKDRNDEATSNTWQFDSGDNFAKAEEIPEMKKTRYFHGCGIFHSIHHGFRPLLVVAGSNGGTGGRNSEFWDFTVPGSTWQLCSKSHSFSIIHYIRHYFDTVFYFLNMTSCIAKYKIYS